MRLFPVIFLAVSGLTACSSAGEERTVCGYDSSTDCLNGTAIVSLGSKYGLIDSCGREILPCSYDDLYYLTDELAVAFSEGDCGFYDRSGRRLAAAEAPDDANPGKMLELYKDLREDCRIRWDSILEQWRRLRGYCLSGTATAEEAARMAEEIRQSLNCVSGPMEKDQKAAFETEYSGYR
jgi:hypothetical protein